MRGKHASGKFRFFNLRSQGKHFKNEMVVYNPIYAKISSCLGSLAIATSLITFATFGKYKGTLASSDTARVAKYMLKLSKTDVSITEFIPNTTQSINFEVKNYDELENEKNEVKLKYRILLDTPVSPNLPIDYKLYRIYDGNVEEEIILTNGISTYIDVELANTTHAYRLDLIWRNNCDEIIYQNLIDNIKISIDSEQVD